MRPPRSPECSGTHLGHGQAPLVPLVTRMVAMMRRTRRHLAGRRCMVRRPTATHYENFDANNARGRAGSCRKLLGWPSSHQLERSHSASIWPQTGPLCAGGARQARRRLPRLLFLLCCSFLPVPSCFDPSPVAGAALPFAPSSHCALALMRPRSTL